MRNGLSSFRIFAQMHSWLRAMRHRRRLESDMEAELQLHLEHLTDDLIRAGLPPAEAARRARIALGPALVHKEGMRGSLGLRWFDELSADVRFGIRILAKSPGFTLIAALSLALAIGANTTIFAMGKQLLFDRLNVPHPEQLRMLRWNGDGHEVVQSMWGDFDSTAEGGMTSSVFSYPVYEQLRDHNQKLQDLIAFKEDGMNATVRGNAQRVNAALVSGNFYAALEVRPQLGRALQPSDDAVPGSGSVAVISDGLWQKQYGRSPSVLGQTVTLNQAVVTIVGVNPRGFTGVKNVLAPPDLFVPISMQPVVDPKGKTSLLTDATMWWVNVVARTKPGVKDSEAQAALDVQLRAAVRATMPMAAGDTLPRLALVEGSRGLHYADRMFKKPIFVLSGFTAFVVLLACANIANLLLARGAQRQREMSVRLALGAGRARILRQLLTESLLLAAIGGAGGILLGYIGSGALPMLLTNAWERSDASFVRRPFDWGVFAFTVSVTLITGVIFGSAPAWLAARAEVSSSLKETAQRTSRRRKGLAGKSIVAFQIALSTLLVVGAGLFVRTLVKLNSVDVGFQADHLVLFEISPPAYRYQGPKSVQLHQQLEQRFAAVPGVERVAPGSLAYISQSMDDTDFFPEGEIINPKEKHAEYENSVGTDFFPTLGIPILAGRGFGLQDTSTSPKVGIINQSLARKRFPNSNPIGKRFKADRDTPSDWIQIVGICADTRYSDLRGNPPPQFFLPYAQQASVGTLTYQVRTRVEPSALFPALRQVVQSVDRDLPIIDFRTQREQINATMQIERAFAALTAGFGVLALALACVGIYGIMAYSVAQRTNEIGIRLALGAQPGQVRSMILRESTWLTVVGILAGAGSALLLTRLVKSMLYGVAPNDPVTLAAGVALLLGVAVAAAWIPARRAASVQPMEALRHE
ncbi:MAG: ABC transporter permease [Terracidiphilus sp.]